MTAPSDDKFKLAGGDAAFGSRAKNIFDGLESLEARHIAVESSEAVQRESYALMKPDPSDDLFSSSSEPVEDSTNFQVPARPPPKRIHQSLRPGYETSPSKWKRYDLSDISVGQLTEQSNQKAAMDFLNRFQVPTDDAAQTIDADHDTKHVFRKPESKGEAKQPVNARHCEMEDKDDDDNTDDLTRTQVLSFAEDELLGDGGQTVGGKAQFRRRRVKQPADRQVRSQINCSDDDEEKEHITDVVKIQHQAHDKKITSRADNSQRNSDSDSDSDNFSELAQLGSDSDQELEATRDTSDVEKYSPEDVDLDSID